jgi:hypothetical protein
MTGRHSVTITHEDPADDAAGWMLYLLHVGIDDDGTLGDDRSGELGGRRPSAETADQQKKREHADRNVPAELVGNLPEGPRVGLRSAGAAR